MLLSIRNSALRWLTVPLMLTTIMLVTACDSSSTAPATQETRSYDGKALFSGLFFADGDASHLFAKVWQIDTLEQHVDTEDGQQLLDEYGDEIREYPESEAAKTASDAFVTWIEENEPGFFDRFETAMQSQNQVKIRSAVLDAGQLIQTAAKDMVDEETLLAGQDGDLATIMEANPLMSKGTYYETETVLYVQLYGAVAIAVALFIALTQVDATPLRTGESASSFQFDESIQILTESVRHETPRR